MDAVPNTAYHSGASVAACEVGWCSHPGPAKKKQAQTSLRCSPCNRGREERHDRNANSATSRRAPSRPPRPPPTRDDARVHGPVRLHRPGHPVGRPGAGLRRADLVAVHDGQVRRGVPGAADRRFASAVLAQPRDLPVHHRHRRDADDRVHPHRPLVRLARLDPRVRREHLVRRLRLRRRHRAGGAHRLSGRLDAPRTVVVLGLPHDRRLSVCPGVQPCGLCDGGEVLHGESWPSP